MIRFRDRGARGRHAGAWVDSYHSFSFADYVDPANMGFRALRVINEDRVTPGAGFPEHEHADMEILTYVLEGAIEHRDSLGNVANLRRGDVQLMSAGTGVAHSEMNADAHLRAHFLQIWIIPDSRGLPSGYQQKSFADLPSNRLVEVATPDGRAGSLRVHQDVTVSLARIEDGYRVDHSIRPGRGCWVQAVRGILALNGTEMREGDGAAVEDEPGLVLEAETDCELLLFDLA
ncbi:pirin family protein [Sphingosinicella sp. CPCC 101087]|uniref:pirin family protein n=1 Tax=Sphingosinicella sp. CPCC 101087 TaxID=2497754 RepID=UPI00101C4058|nr:pirin family protein [Sphingosinicella sp. CPCC 101087]